MFINSTERRPSRCVRVEVRERARRLKFLPLGMPCVARIRRLGPARDVHGARVARRVEASTRQRQYWSLCDIKGSYLGERQRRCVWIVAPSSSKWSSGASISLLVREKVLRRITRYHHPEQRSRSPHVPQASTTATHSSLEMLWSVSELERAPNMPHRRHGLHFFVHAGVCGM